MKKIVVIIICIAFCISTNYAQTKTKIDTVILKYNNDPNIRNAVNSNYRFIIKFKTVSPSDTLLLWKKESFLIEDFHRPENIINTSDYGISFNKDKKEVNIFGNFPVFKKKKDWTDKNKNDTVIYLMILTDSVLKYKVLYTPNEIIKYTDSTLTINKWLNQRLQLNTDFKGLSNSKDIGLDYSLKLDYYSSRNFTLSSTSKGYIDFQNTQTNKLIDIDILSAKLFQTYDGINIYVNKKPRPTINSFGVLFKPFDIEANQRFDTINYAGKLYFVCSIPYLDQPIIWLQRLTNTNKFFLPPTIYFGLAATRNIKGIDSATTINVRYDFGWVYNFPLTNKINLKSKQSFYYTTDKKDNNKLYNLLEVSTEFLIREDLAFLIKYQNGALPPSFNKNKTISLGFSFSIN
jgi:hypothetical protein